MQKRLLTLYVDDASVKTLRRLAAQRGFICKRGPGAPEGRGSISELFMELAREMTRPTA